MANYNRVVLAGNITRDPEIRFTGQGVPVCSFGLAVNRVRSRDRDAVDFFDVSVWREQGEAVATWEAKDGSKRSKVDVVADQVQFLGKGNGASEDGDASG